MLELVLYLGILPALLNAEASESFINDVLARHNYYRAMYGVGSLKIDPGISSKAQAWANWLEFTLTLAHNSELLQYGIGENLKYMGDQSETGSMAVDSLYEVGAKMYADGGYCSSTGFPPAETGQFTQIVWKNTKYIGVGKAGPYLVLNYYPGGNIHGQFLENVLCPNQ